MKMGKVVKITSKNANESILNETVATAKKRITKKAKGKAIKLKARTSREQEQVETTSNRKQRKIEVQKQRKEKFLKELGVLYVSHIPHGFFEEQLEKFFSQFGKVQSVKLARSTISGRSKGHAFIIFRYKEVAEIAAETANNYLMGKRILKAKVIPSDEVKPKWFYHTTPSNIKLTVASKRRQKFIKKINRKFTPEEGKIWLNAQKRSLGRMVKKLNDIGIDYKCNIV